MMLCRHDSVSDILLHTLCTMILLPVIPGGSSIAQSTQWALSPKGGYSHGSTPAHKSQSQGQPGVAVSSSSSTVDSVNSNPLVR